MLQANFTSVSFRRVLVLIAVLAMLSESAKAQQKVFWRDNDPGGQSPQADPYDENTNPDGWRDPGGGNTGDVMIPAGQSIYFGIMNNQVEQRKVVKLKLNWLTGDRSKFAKPTATGYINGLPVAGYISTGRNKKQINASWETCPAWEYFTITNFSQSTQTVRIFASVSPTICLLADGSSSGAAGDATDTLAISNAQAGVLGQMTASVRLNMFTIFPEHQFVNYGVNPTFDALPHTGSWTSDPAFIDPNGRFRPEGGVSFMTDGPGLFTEDAFGLSMAMIDSMDTRYTIFAHNGDSGEWFEYILDQRELPWYEDFEIYEEGELLHGASDWRGWDDDPVFDAPITTTQFNSEPNALEIKDDTDIVRPFEDAQGGSWTFEGWQYIPSDFASGGGGDQFDGSYFILLNTYDDGIVHEPDHWSVQMQFDPNVGLLKVFHGQGKDTIDIPYEVDRWVKIQIEVDLEDDWTQIYYDDELVAEYSWIGGVIGERASQLKIEALDLFANGTSSVYYDDFSLVQSEPPPEPCPADLTGDGILDFFDVSAFLNAYNAGEPIADFTGDGLFDFFDVSAFLNAFNAGCP